MEAVSEASGTTKRINRWSSVLTAVRVQGVLRQHPEMVQGLLNEQDIAYKKRSSTVTVLVTRDCSHIDNYPGEMDTPLSRMTDDSSMRSTS